MSCAYFTRSRQIAARAINWDGDRIVIPPVVEAFRPIVGKTGAQRCAVDIRSFISPTANAVLKKVIAQDFRAFVAKRHGASLSMSQLERPQPGAFDLCATLLAEYVGSVIPYAEREGEYFQLPEETLARKEGDCEDRAILLASLLIAAGISAYNVRVALGTVEYPSSGRTARAAHAWVVYKDEVGHWLLLEPRTTGKATQTAKADAELPDTFNYDPEFIFNGDHLWFAGEAGADGALPLAKTLRARWNGLDPTFVGGVHKSIITEAFGQAPLRKLGWLCHYLEAKFTVLFGQTIDDPDLHIAKYEPSDHFDNGLIDPSWDKVDARLSSFYKRPLNDPQGAYDLCYALHAIADFYAHTTYAHFAIAAKAKETPFSRKNGPHYTYDYASDAAFSAFMKRWEPNADWFQGTAATALSGWKGRVISGRYSQPHDRQSLIEGVTRTLTDKQIPKGYSRAYLGSLPHHDSIAVDESTPSKKQTLYSSQYGAQFAWRRKTAVLHVAQVIAAHPALLG